MRRSAPLRPLLLGAVLTLAPLAACESEPPPPPPSAPADALADSVNYQPTPAPIPDNTTLPDTLPQP